MPAAPTCPGLHSATGLVWLDDPDDLTLVERPLHCLAAGTALVGSLVSRIVPDSWGAALATNGKFDFGFDDDRLQEVESYYVVVSMAGHLEPLLRLDGPLAPVEIELLKNEHMSSSRYRYVPRKIWLGLAGITPRVLSAQILGHEYAHHVVMSHAPELAQVLNEAIADYLAADFTGRPQILSIERFALPATVRDQVREQARRLLERTVDNRWVYPADVITKGQLCAFLRSVDAAMPDGQEFVSAARLGECDALNDQQLNEAEPHLTGRIVSGALWELRGELGASVVGQLIFAALKAGEPVSSLERFSGGLVDRDEVLFDGAHRATIERVFAARGL